MIFLAPLYLSVNVIGMWKFPSMACRYGAVLDPLEAYRNISEDIACVHDAVKNLFLGYLVSRSVIL